MLVDEAAQVVDTRRYRDVIGGFATGVAVVTTRDVDGDLQGMTVNSLTSVSLRPMLLLVCLTRGSRTARAIAGAGAFVVNLLREGQDELSNRFARPGDDHFASATYRLADGLPILGGTLGHVCCRTERIEDAGDHEIVLGEVTAAELRLGSPLVFFRGRYETVTGAGREAAASWYC